MRLEGNDTLSGSQHGCPAAIKVSDVLLRCCRIAELNRKRELNAAAELKKKEIALAHKYARQALLAKFLRTAAQPPLFWQPAKHCADTILLEEQRQLDLSVWMVGHLNLKPAILSPPQSCRPSCTVGDVLYACQMMRRS